MPPTATVTVRVFACASVTLQLYELTSHDFLRVFLIGRRRVRGGAKFKPLMDQGMRTAVATQSSSVRHNIHSASGLRGAK